MNVREWLKGHLDFKELGYTEQGEEFTRYTLLKTRWFSIYLHRLRCPRDLRFCHDHPWNFWAFLLLGGYFEQRDERKAVFRPPGAILYRPAKGKHNVWTGQRTNWSVIVVSSKRRDWGFQDCRDPGTYRLFETPVKGED